MATCHGFKEEVMADIRAWLGARLAGGRGCGGGRPSFAMVRRLTGDTL